MPSHADESHAHSHGHSHGHGHGLTGGWDTWLSVPALRAVLTLVVGLALLTVLGLVVLWPDGSGRERAIEEAASLGLVTERFDATVDTVFEGECSYSTRLDPQDCRTFTFLMKQGPDTGAIVALPELNLTIGTPAPELAVGDPVVLGYEETTDFYFYADRDRGSALVWLALLFVVVVIGLGRKRGVLALVSMAITVAVLIGFIAPSVLDGNDPVLVSVVAGSVIAFVGLYLTHGFNPTTTVALAGTLLALVLTLAVSAVFFWLAGFSGLATEEGLTLPLVSDVNLSSLLLGGAILGALGALDDVTVTQVATVAELRHRNRSLTIAELVASGIRVGREHIASTINTLLLAYAGASMPLLLLLAASDQSLATTANSEAVAVEIVRTLCGSIGLVSAVPITTIMAAVLVGGAPAELVASPETDDHGPPGAAASDDDSGRPDGGVGPSGSTDRGTRPPRPTIEPTPIEPSWDDFAPDDIDDR